MRQDTKNYLSRRPGGHYLARQPLDINLARTCRHLYEECIPLLYATNTFLYNDLRDIVHFSRTVLPQRLASIRHLQISLHVFSTEDGNRFASNQRKAWKRAWKVIAKQMTGLRDLSLDIKYSKDMYNEEKIHFLPPLERLRGLRTFVLYVFHADQGTRNRKPSKEILD